MSWEHIVNICEIRFHLMLRHHCTFRFLNHQPIIKELLSNCGGVEGLREVGLCIFLIVADSTQSSPACRKCLRDCAYRLIFTHAESNTIMRVLKGRRPWHGENKVREGNEESGLMVVIVRIIINIL